MRRPPTEGSCIKDVAEHFRGGITTFGDVHVFLTGSHCLQSSFMKLLKIYFKLCSFVPLLLSHGAFLIFIDNWID